MEVSFQRVDLAACFATRTNPALLLRRDEAQSQWLVAQSPITPEQAIIWGVDTKSEVIHVPLVPYLMRTQPEAVMGFMFQLGIIAGAAAQKMASPRKLRRLHLGLGAPMEQLTDGQGEGLRGYLGFALEFF